MYDRTRARHPEDETGVRAVVDVQDGQVTVDLGKRGAGRRIIKLHLSPEAAEQLGQNLIGASATVPARLAVAA